MTVTRVRQPLAQRAVRLAHRGAIPSVRSCGNAVSPCPVAAHQARQVRAYGERKWERAAPPGFGVYETLVVLKPTLTEEERDQELARFESFLHSVRLGALRGWQIAQEHSLVATAACGATSLCSSFGVLSHKCRCLMPRGFSKAAAVAKPPYGSCPPGQQSTVAITQAGALNQRVCAGGQPKREGGSAGATPHGVPNQRPLGGHLRALLVLCQALHDTEGAAAALHARRRRGGQHLATHDLPLLTAVRRWLPVRCGALCNLHVPPIASFLVFLARRWRRGQAWKLNTTDQRGAVLLLSEAEAYVACFPLQRSPLSSYTHHPIDARAVTKDLH